MDVIHPGVRNIDEANFWSYTVGFEVKGRSKRPGAAFVRAGGHHHYLGLNAWNGVWVSPPSAEPSRHAVL